MLSGEKGKYLRYEIKNWFLRIKGEVKGKIEVWLFKMKIPQFFLRFQKKGDGKRKRVKKKMWNLKDLSSFLEFSDNININFSTSLPDIDYPLSVLMNGMIPRLHFKTFLKDKPFLNLHTTLKFKLLAFLKKFLFKGKK